MGLAIGVAAFVAYVALGHGGAEHHTSRVLAAVALGLGGALIGKIVGLIRAKHRASVGP